MTDFIDFDPMEWDSENDYEYAVVFQYDMEIIPDCSFDCIVVTAQDYLDTAWDRFYERHPFHKARRSAVVLFVQRLGPA
jgi:hypothetical protein